MKTETFRIEITVLKSDVEDIQEQIQDVGIECTYKFAKKVLRDQISYDATKFINEPCLFGFGFPYEHVSDFKKQYNIK